MTQQINLTAGNVNLAELRIKKCFKSWVNLAMKNLPSADRKSINIISPTLFGTTFSDEQGIVSANYKDGSFAKMKAPSLMQCEGKLVTKLGRDIVELQNLDTGELLLEIKKVTLDKYDDLSLVVAFEYAEDEYIEWPFPLAVQKEHRGDNLDERKIEGWVKKGQFDKLANILYEAKEAGGNAVSSPMVKPEDLKQGVAYEVVTVREVNASYGKSWIINIIVDGVENQMWAPYSVKTFFNLGAQLGDKTTLTLVEEFTQRNGKIGYAFDISGLVMPKREGSAELDGLF